MTRANAVSSRVFSLRWVRTGVAAALGILILAFALSGCGWIFKKQHKPLVVDIELTASDSLNFDGDQAQVVALRLYILKSESRFMQGDTRAYFDDTWNPEWRNDVFYKQDTMATASATLIPGETKTIRLQVPYAYARDASPVFAAIADFLRPPSGKAERVAFGIQKKSKQTIKLTVGKDWVAQAGKK